MEYWSILNLMHNNNIKIHAFFTIFEYCIDSKIEWPQNTLTSLLSSASCIILKIYTFKSFSILQFLLSRKCWETS